MFSIHAGFPDSMPSPTTFGVSEGQDAIRGQSDRSARNELHPLSGRMLSGRMDVEEWSPDEVLSRIGAGTKEPGRTIIAGELPMDVVQ